MDWMLAFNLIPFSTVCCPFLINAEMFWPEFVLTGELCLVLRFRVGRKVLVTIPGQIHRDTAEFRVTQSDRANAVALSLPKKTWSSTRKTSWKSSIDKWPLVVSPKPRPHQIRHGYNTPANNTHVSCDKRLIVPQPSPPIRSHHTFRALIRYQCHR